MVNFCWFFFKWGLLAIVLAGLAAIPYFWRRVDEEIRLRVQGIFASHYSKFDVYVRSAQLVEGKGIEVRGLSIRERNNTSPRAELAYLEQVFLTCDTRLQELIKGTPEITHVHVSRPILRASRNPDGSWNASKLLPLPKFSNNTPEGAIESATIEIFDPNKKPASRLTLRDVNLSWKAGNAVDRSRGLLALHGQFAADHLQRVEFGGNFNPQRGVADLRCSITNLELSPELRQNLPQDASERLSALGSFRGAISGTFQLTRDPAAQPPLRFRAQGQLQGGRIDDPRLPYALTDLACNVELNNEGISIHRLSARNGRMVLQGDCHVMGYAPDRPVAIQLRAENLRVDRQLGQMMPSELRECWSKFLPEGEVNVDLNFAFDGKNWTRAGIVTCLNLSFLHYKFPYRLNQGTGTLKLAGRVLDMDLKAYSGSQPVSIQGRIFDPGQQFTGSIQLWGKRISFDETLLAAMDHSTQEVVRSLNAQGNFNFDARYWRDDPGDAVHQHIHVSLNRCTLNYARFPYPLSNVRGDVQMDDGLWTFNHLQGTNDTGVVKCQGSLNPHGEGPQLVLDFTGDNVPLEEELRDALPPDIQRVWNLLQPRGALDLRAIRVTYVPRTKQMSVNISMTPHEDTVSIEPVSFPYRIEKLRGTMHYRDRHVDFENLEGVHGRTQMGSGGSCDFAADGSWRLRLEKMSVERIRVDRDYELKGALPEGLYKAVAELNPSGPMNMAGALEFEKGGRPESPLSVRWDVMLDLQRVNLDCAIQLENLWGGVHLAGSSEGSRFSSKGDLALESVTYKNLQFTDVTGPLWIDNVRVLMGSWPDAPAAGRTPRRITAKLFGGTLLGDCKIDRATPVQYTLRAALAGADLGQFAKENISGRQKLNGKIASTLRLQGTSSGPHTLNGTGNILLREADIYELPVMVALLKILSIKTPDTTASTQSDIVFKVQGEHIYFDHIDFSGDAFSLSGSGQMNLDKQLDLTFHATLPSANLQIPFIKSVFGQASRQIMQIRVEGSIDNPLTRNEPFPGVSEALQGLQANLPKPLERAPAVPQAWGLRRTDPPRR